MLSKFLDPKNDVAFKKIFGTEKNKDILIHFLNDMIVFKGRARIKEVTFLKNNLDPETAAQKTSIVDILCKDENDNIYIVEMQVATETGFEKRAQYYASKAYISQARVGGKYFNLKEVIFLAIADFVMFTQKKGFKSDHIILDMDSHENDLKDFSFTFLELPKFNKDMHHLTTMIDKWAYFFKHAAETTEKDLPRLTGQDHIIERAYEELNRFSWNDRELLTYDQAEKYKWAYEASMDYKFYEGKAEGMIEGKAEGIIEGEKIAKLHMAKTMLRQKIGIQTIITVTGLSKTEIESIL